MTVKTTVGEGDDLRAVLARTPAGDAELQQPRAGLSLPQRKLLTLVDGGHSLAALADSEPTLHRERLARDASVLLRLGLLAGDAPYADPTGSAVQPATLPPRAEPAPWAPIATPPGVVSPDAARSEPTPRAAASAGPPPAARRSMALPVVVSIAALGAAAAAGYAALGNSDAPQARAAPSPAAATIVTTAAPPPAAAAAQAPVTDTAPATSTPATETPAQPVEQVAPVAAVVAAPVAPARVPGQAAAAASAALIAQRPAPVVAKGLPPAAAPARITPSSVPAVTAAATPPTAADLPVAPAPAATPATASAAPAAIAAAAVVERPLLPVRRVEPEFPREAARQGIDQGTVLAQLRIGADGRVEAVTTNATGPSRVFERAARAALAEWSFPPGAPGRVYQVQLDFRR